MRSTVEALIAKLLPTDRWVGSAASQLLSDIYNSVMDYIDGRGSTVFVSELGHFPDPVGGVITLPANTTWILLDVIDMGSNRLACDGTVTIAGEGAETTGLTSSTLGAGIPLIYTETTLTLRDMSITTPVGAVCVEVDGSLAPGTAALDWRGVNFFGGRAAELTDVDNSINFLLGMFGDGYRINGSINTLAFIESIFVPDAGEYGVKIDGAASVNRRFRLNNCAIIAGPPGSTGLDIPNSTIANTEGFILNLINFSGSGTYINGTTELDDEARWIECRGITNTTRVGEMEWSGNATVTTISVAGTYVKASGVSTAGDFNQRFTHDPSGRLTYISELAQTFQVSITASMSSGNNKVLGIQAYKNGTPANTHVSKSTSSGTGRSENVVYQAIIRLEANDYVELYIANTTDTTNITVEDMTVQIIAI